MIYKETTAYDYNSYFPRDVVSSSPYMPRQQNVIHRGWREKICQWNYNIVDHFDLPREVVSISLNYFDRYMATLSKAEDPEKSTCSTTTTKASGTGKLALLASLGTLYLATKVHVTNHNEYDRNDPPQGSFEQQHRRALSVTTLANLSRGQFGAESIVSMETLLLNALRWKLHPPTLFAFVSLLLELIPTIVANPSSGLKPSIRKEILDVAIYLSELSVCDSFFLERHIPPSVIAFAAIINAMDDLLIGVTEGFVGFGKILEDSGDFTARHYREFVETCQSRLGITCHSQKRKRMFQLSRDRLRSMYTGVSTNITTTIAPTISGVEVYSSVATTTTTNEQLNSTVSINSRVSNKNINNQDNQPQHVLSTSYNPPSSPTSTTDMSLSTINSTVVHSVADTTIGGDGMSVKRGNTMISPATNKSGNNLGNNSVGGFETPNEYENPSNSNNNRLRYSQSPPEEGYSHQNSQLFTASRNGYHDVYEQQQQNQQHFRYYNTRSSTGHNGIARMNQTAFKVSSSTRHALHGHNGTGQMNQTDMACSPIVFH